MRRKLIFFQVTATIVLAFSLFMIVALAIQLNSIISYPYYSTGQIFSNLVGMLIFLFSSFFMFFCIWLAQKKAPDKEITKAQNILFTVSLVFFWILTAIILIMLLYLVSELFSQNAPVGRVKKYQIYAISFLFLLLSSMVITAILSNSLRKSINFKYKYNLSEAINNLGSDGLS